MPAVRAQGIVHGGQQPISDATIQLYGLVPSGGGLIPTALLSATVTTSDGSSAMNPNANAGNLNNTLPAGSFTISGDYTCPGSDPLVYLTATGGNPGLAAGTNNTAIVMMAALTDCNTLINNAATTYIFADELTTIGSLAALYPYANSSGALSAASGQVTAFNSAFAQVSEYTSTSTGSAPGPGLPSGYYASSTEIDTLGDIVAPCVNSTGLDSNCSTLFSLTESGGVAPTNIAGAIVNILNNPTQNASSLFALGGSVVPFQPVDSVAPSSWALPILPMAATPTFSISGGTYSSAQFVTLADTTSGSIIHYTTDGSTPTSASPTFGGTAITVSSSETINAIAVASGFGPSAVASAGYTITGSSSTYTVSGIATLANCEPAGYIPTMTLTLTHGSTTVQTTTNNSTGNFTFSGVPNGTYTITPSIIGPSSVFFPVSQSVTVNGGGVTLPTVFSANLGYTVSGNVAYSGPSTGQIFLALSPSFCGANFGLGTSVSSTGAFTIQGVQPGPYTLRASMDNLNNGYANASNPVGSVSVPVTANYTGANVTLVDPAPVTLSSAPGLESVSGFDGGIVAVYDEITSTGTEVEQPASYTLQWSVAASPFTVVGSQTFPANGYKSSVWFTNSTNQPTLTNGSTYYFRAYATSGGTPVSAYSSVYGPVTIGPSSSGNPVTGTVSFTGTASGPLYAGFYNGSTGTFYGKYFPNPTSPQSYSLLVPTGSNYVFVGILDQNNNGVIDADDIANVGGNSSDTLASISGPTQNEDLTLPSAYATGTAMTQNNLVNYPGGSNQFFGLSLLVNGLVKRPVAVELISGPHVISPVDLSPCDSAGSGCGTQGFPFTPTLGYVTPTVGDTYTFDVTYSDGTTGTVTASVTTILTNFATNLAPATGTTSSLTPTFSWTDPVNASNYTYQFFVNSNTAQIWRIPGVSSGSTGFSSSITTIPWYADPTGGGSHPTVTSLSPNITYVWYVELQDSNGNTATTSQQYLP
ncbi:MAG: chitobiase/beta-hexosaminidase C-terminal domain-containing protein [Acidobacteriaceae bacterium]